MAPMPQAVREAERPEEAAEKELAPELCDIVVTHSGISRRHCGVRYDSLIGQYRVIAYTSQPIKMSNGKILRTDSYTLARPGTMVYLLGDEEVIRLG